MAAIERWNTRFILAGSHSYISLKIEWERHLAAIIGDKSEISKWGQI